MYWDALIQNKQKRREEQGPLLLNKYLVCLVCGLAGKTCCISKGWNDYINLNVSSVTSLQLLPCLPANTKTNRWAGAQPGSQERSPWGEECSHHNFYFVFFSFFLFPVKLLRLERWKTTCCWGANAQCLRSCAVASDILVGNPNLACSSGLTLISNAPCGLLGWWESVWYGNAACY